MSSENEVPVRQGTFLYDGRIECDVRVVRSVVRYGTGDHQDEPKVGDDQLLDTYYVWYGSTTERGVFTSGGGAYASEAEAVAAIEAATGIGPTVRWNP